jgi:hypothetical protein
MANTRTTRTTTGTRTARARTLPLKPATIPFMGAQYKLAETIGVWPMMQLAAVSESGLSARDSKGLAAIYSYLKQVLHEDDWPQFEDDMITKKTDDLEALMKFLSDAVALVQERLEKKGRRPGAARKTIAGEIEDGDPEE